MKQQHGRKPRQKSRADSRAERLQRALAACGGTPAEMLELYYWSKERGFRKLIRAIAMMPEATKVSLATFLTLADDTSSVAAGFDARGVLMLFSVQASKLAALAQQAADEEAHGRRRLLN